MFASRIDAAQRLATALAQYRGKHPLVLAIPRGAVAMGRIVADALDGQFDVVLVRKLRSPYNPELAIGAIDETGHVHLARHVEVDDAYLQREKEEQLGTLRQRRARYTSNRAPIDVQGRLVIVVDDGLATGATMLAALNATRARGPSRLVCAVPVAAPESLALVRPHCDEVVCLAAPPEFYAVGQFYRAFPQVNDEEVIALLAQPPRGASAP